MVNICVYSASSNAVPEIYYRAADELGGLIALNGYTLVYGGGAIGLMGAVARAVHRCDGKVIGVIPEFMMEWGVSYNESDELIITSDMRERKRVMEEMANAFIGLPGGFGTLEELLEVITLKQLRRHNKSIVFMNIDGYYNYINSAFELMFQQNFTRQVYRELYYFADNASDAIDHITNYTPAIIESKI